MLSGTDQLLRVMRAARMTREEAEAELVREEADAAQLFTMSAADLAAEARALSTIDATESILAEAEKTGSGEGRGGGKKTVTVDMAAYERALGLVSGRQAERRQSREYREALRARLGRLDEASRPLYTPAVRSPLQRYIDALERS